MILLQAFSSVLFLLQDGASRVRMPVEPLRAIQTSSPSSVSETASKLQVAVCEQFRTNGLGVKSPEIEDLIDDLVSKTVQFDPLECLNGPLYAVQYIDLGPTKKPPSWVQYTTKGSIAGQLYQVIEDDKIDTLRVVNYAELFQGAIKLKTEGSCALANQAESSSQPIGDKDEPKIALQQFFQWPPNMNVVVGKRLQGRKLLQCPVDYIVPPESSLPSTVSIFGRDLFTFNIEGEGTARVMYADENMRIFEAPPTEKNWEPRGIRTVQVRIDLLRDEFEL